MVSPLFAEADPFWSVRTVNDVVGIVGLALTLFSIWYTWASTRKELREDIRRAERAAAEAVERVAAVLLETDLAEAVAFLQQADGAFGNREWNKALLRLDDALIRIARTSANRQVAPNEKQSLANALLAFRTLAHTARTHARSGQHRAHLSTEELQVIGRQIELIETIRGRLRSSTLMVSGPREDNG